MRRPGSMGSHLVGAPSGYTEGKRFGWELAECRICGGKSMFATMPCARCRAKGFGPYPLDDPDQLKLEGMVDDE